MSKAGIVKANIGLINKTNLNSKTIRKEGAGKAYQSVSQSMAMVVQDAANYEGNLFSLSQAAIAVSIEKIVQNPEMNIPKYSPVIGLSQDIVNTGAKTVFKVARKAGRILEDFPSGD
ncbi:hypothetical protein [Moorena sp. SIO4G3]|uniref:hypothetical protein n=1 Tax=Moorena sp. SIO4G3 TaxID=2607821 RepID=UPI00142C5030|nr:hypothetical protein [Moorena sp. SIO4G3]NEO78752.1 hypothetical protein [Moorena sp. SIO4G3]